jgi:hypothetical protein
VDLQDNDWLVTRRGQHPHPSTVVYTVIAITIAGLWVWFVISHADRIFH